MKIKADYANAPQWKETTIKSSLPKELKCLDEIAHNMWWAWNYEGRDLFKSLDADLYEKCNANPVLLLERLSYDRKEAIVKDKETMAKVKNVYKMFREYMDVKPNAKRPSVAYFCMEYGINQVVKIYSGGLGMLAGDYLKEASDSNVDMCAVGFLYRYGYFKQSLSTSNLLFEPIGIQKAVPFSLRFFKFNIQSILFLYKKSRVHISLLRYSAQDMALLSQFHDLMV